MRLATPEAVLNVLGIQISSGSLATAGAALDATFALVETALDTDLPSNSRTDYFDLTRYEKVDPILRLSCGFVSKDDALVVRQTESGSPLVGSFGTVIPDTEYTVDYERGTVSLIGSYYAGKKSLSVAYTAGFAVEDDEVTLAGIPDGLKQGGLMRAVTFMLTNPVNVTKEKARFMAVTAVNGFNLQSNQALSKFTRPRGGIVWNSATSKDE